MQWSLLCVGDYWRLTHNARGTNGTFVISDQNDRPSASVRLFVPMWFGPLLATTQDLVVYDITGEDSDGMLIGSHRGTGIGRPRFWERAQYYGEEKRLASSLDAAESLAA